MTAITAEELGALAGTVLADRYRLLRLLGKGGMGAVFEAQDEGTGERLAVKVLSEAAHGTAATDALARFLREARVTARLSHPNIIAVRDGGIDRATSLPWLSMQLLRGLDTEQLLQRTGPLDPAVAVRIALQAAQGLSAAHAAGVVHRDIKPSNLFLDEREGVVTVKVCDFGLAKPSADGASLTQTGSVLGSPLYMAPEQLRSARHADARADVWSLAMSLYHALAGQPAFHACTTFSELAVALVTEEVPHLQVAAPWVDPDLALAVHMALLRDPLARCPSVEALAQALRPHAEGREVIEVSDLAPVEAARRSLARSRVPYPLAYRPPTLRPSADAGEAERRDPLLGKVLAQRYELTDVLGRGGMGAVYDARLPDGSRAAVKVLGVEPGRESRESLARFVREARMAMSIDSPYVVRVLEADTDPTYGVPFIAMERLAGQDLDKLLDELGPLAEGPAAALFLQACRGLSAAHRLGVVHRDVKPANLFLHEPRGRALVLKICDFGVAKHAPAESAGEQSLTDLTRTGGIVGSPMYMSPEQARSAKHVDPRTDIWSLGMTLHQALSGKKPWAGCGTVGELIVAICTQSPAALDQLAPWVDPALARVVHRAIARDPDARFPTMDAFAEALAPFASTAPLSRASLAALSREASDRRGELPGPRSLRPSVAGSTTIAASVDPRGAGPPARRGLPLGAAAAVAVAAAAALGLAAYGRRPPPPALPAAPASPALPGSPEPPVTSAPASPSGSSAPRLRASLLVAPAGATVLVDGAARAPTADGLLELEGEVGDVFRVVVSLGKAQTEQRVVMLRSGSLMPSSVALGTGASPAAPRTHPADRGAAGAASDAFPRPPPSAAPAPPAPPQTLPRPRDSWNLPRPGSDDPGPAATRERERGGRPRDAPGRKG